MNREQILKLIEEKREEERVKKAEQDLKYELALHKLFVYPQYVIMI